jgi:probable phosphoglycerate mutase
MSGHLWLIRHAETEWSRTGRHTGRTDVPLTEAGRDAARALRARLEGHRFARVLVSPLSRARETAVLAGLADNAEFRDELLEWDYGAYEGLTTRGIRGERPGWYLWADGVPEGETADDVGARVDRIIADVLPTLEQGEDVAVVAHGHVLRVLAARWVEQPAAFGGRLALETGGVSRLGFERDVRVIWGWNT